MKPKVRLPKKDGVAKLRERFYEIRRNIKPSPELLEIIKEKTPRDEEKGSQKEPKKIARPKPSNDLDL